jgi:hypothetical protein
LYYADDAELAERVETILVLAVSRSEIVLEMETLLTVDTMDGLSSSPMQALGELRPYADLHVRIDFKHLDCHLTLTNTGNASARNVRFQIDTKPFDDPWTVEKQGELISEIGPLRGQSFRVDPSSGSEGICRIAWEDARGSHTESIEVRLTPPDYFLPV